MLGFHSLCGLAVRLVYPHGAKSTSPENPLQFKNEYIYIYIFTEVNYYVCLRGINRIRKNCMICVCLLYHKSLHILLQLLLLSTLNVNRYSISSFVLRKQLHLKLIQSESLLNMQIIYSHRFYYSKFITCCTDSLFLNLYCNLIFYVLNFFYYNAIIQMFSLFIGEVVNYVFIYYCWCHITVCCVL